MILGSLVLTLRQIQIQIQIIHCRLVLTVREPTAWYRSVATTLLPLVSQIDRLAFELLVPNCCLFQSPFGVFSLVNRWSFLLRFMCWVLYQSSFQIKLLGILFRCQHNMLFLYSFFIPIFLIFRCSIDILLQSTALKRASTRDYRS